MFDPTAVVGRRIGAYLIDALIAVAVLMIAFVLLGESGPPGATCDQLTAGSIIQMCGQLNDDNFYATGNTALTIVLIMVGAMVLNQVVLQGITGASVGKLACGIRVVRANGTYVGIPRALVRWLLFIVDNQPFGLGLVGLICAAVSHGHRRVGDMVAGSFVVHRKAAGTPLSLPAKAAATFEPASDTEYPAPPPASPAPPPPQAPPPPPPPPASPPPPPPGGASDWQPPAADR